MDVAGTRVAFTTDSFVVSPIRFPGGDIGELAVNGTINDLAMMGAQPLALSLAYVIEEGLPLEELAAITASAARAAARAGARIVTGDTKVVGRGAADRLFVNTAGIGLVPDGVAPAADRARPGDAIVLSGPIGLHGVAIMSVREGLEFEVEIASDTQALNGLVAAMLAVEPGIRVLRDPTRGGLSSSLNEIAAPRPASEWSSTRRRSRSPAPCAPPARCSAWTRSTSPTRASSSPSSRPQSADAIVAAMQALPEGEGAARIGEVVADHPGMVTIRTIVGSERIVDMLVGEQLPRIC